MLSAFVLLPLPTQAAFVLVDNFEGYADNADVSGVNGWITASGGSPALTASTGIGIVQRAADVSGAQSNVLTIVGGAGFSSVYNASLTPDIADGTTGTLFFQMIRVSAAVDFSVGMTDTALAAYNERAGVESHGGFFTALDGDSATFPTLSQSTLYNIWVVINNGAGSASDTYSLYIQGGAFSTQTQFASGELFRLGTDSSTGGVAGALNAFAVSQSWIQTIAVDNIYVDTAGQNLAMVPEPSSSALLIGSLGMLGIFSRHRRSTAA